jgi:zinc transporter ZupT
MILPVMGRYPMLVVTGSLLIALATIAGAWLGRRNGARREVYFGAAAGALLVIAGVHMLPDAWSAAERAGITVWAILAVAAASFWLAGLAVRRGCACQLEREAAGGAGTASALALHRLLEGVALALGGTVVVAVALFMHAFAEGLAAGTLLHSAPRRRAALWLTAMCVSPVLGTAVVAAGLFPLRAQPVLLAVVAGVLGQAAKVSFGAAFRPVEHAGASIAGTGVVQARLTQIVLSAPAAATVVAAVITTLAVRGLG